jgi:MFS family permease
MGQKPKGSRAFSQRSILGLNAANFFQAEMIGVVLPVLNAYLKEAGWRYDSIGAATALAGLGTLLFQTPAGILTDRLSQRRTLFAAAALLTGACFTLIPMAKTSAVPIDSLLFVAGAAQSFFAPLLAALALALVGYRQLNRTVGTNQGWNHAGNIAAALAAMALVAAHGVSSIFYAVGISSTLATFSVFLIREADLDERRATGLSDDDKNERPVPWSALLTDRTVLFLFLSIFAFHLANAPILPAVALYVKSLHGSDNLMTATVLTAQVVMVPVALLAGRGCDAWGRKAMMAIAFWVLPLRIFSYTFVHTPRAVVWLQSLDGIGAGIYGVVVVALAADLTRGKGHFNALMGLFATALAIGGVAGPLISGVLIQHLGFRLTFYAFAALAVLGAVVFTIFVPETKGRTQEPLAPRPQVDVTR